LSRPVLAQAGADDHFAACFRAGEFTATDQAA